MLIIGHSLFLSSSGSSVFVARLDVLHKELFYNIVFIHFYRYFKMSFSEYWNMPVAK